MKKIIVAFGLSIVFALPAVAQNADHPERSPEKKAEKMTEHMAKKLSLTADQKTAVYEINLQKASADKEDHKANADKYKADMRQILTDEQYEKWEAMQKERKDKSEKHRNKKSQ